MDIERLPAKQREATVRAYLNGGTVRAHHAVADALERRGLAAGRLLTDAGSALAAQYV